MKSLSGGILLMSTVTKRWSFSAAGLLHAWSAWSQAMVVPEHLQLSLGGDTLVHLCERMRSCTGLYRDAAGERERVYKWGRRLWHVFKCQEPYSRGMRQVWKRSHVCCLSINFYRLSQEPSNTKGYRNLLEISVLFTSMCLAVPFLCRFPLPDTPLFTELT